MVFFKTSGVCCGWDRSIDHSSMLSSKDLRRCLEGGIRGWIITSTHSILLPHTDHQLNTVPQACHQEWHPLHACSEEILETYVRDL